MKEYILTLVGVLVFSVVTQGQSLDEKYGKDVESIDAIMMAYYDIISGSANDPWQIERDKYIHAKGAIMVFIDEEGGAQSQTLDEFYEAITSAPREDLYEVELNRKVNRYENIAQVWSTFEIRTDPNVATGARGIAGIELYFSAGRWWVMGWTTQYETDAGIPAKYLKK